VDKSVDRFSGGVILKIINPHVYDLLLYVFGHRRVRDSVTRIRV
jgi:hypothetical protein